MQKFDDEAGVRRRLDLCNMKVSDTEDYFLQFLTIGKKEKKHLAAELSERLSNNSCDDGVKQWFLSVKDKSGQIVGKIEVFPAKEDAFFTIEIPNNQWILRYGDDAIDQFIKTCREKGYFSKIEFDRENPIIDHYRKVHDIQSYIVKTA